MDTGPEPAGWLAWIALAYGLPALMLVMGAVLGDTLATATAVTITGMRDAASAIGALAGLIGGLVMGRYTSRMLISTATTGDTGRILAILPTTSSRD